jgi:hypothetical protein
MEKIRQRSALLAENPLSRNDAVGIGSATVPVALAGVSPISDYF